MVVKQAFEPCVEPYFHPDSYGYRPWKSALQAVGVTRQRCWQYDYVLEFDVKGLFDAIDQTLLTPCVRIVVASNFDQKEIRGNRNDREDEIYGGLSRAVAGEGIFTR